MQKCYATMASRLTWAAEQTNHSRHNERTKGVAETLLLFFEKKKEKNIFS